MRGCDRFVRECVSTGGGGIAGTASPPTASAGWLRSLQSLRTRSAPQRLLYELVARELDGSAGHGAHSVGPRAAEKAAHALLFPRLHRAVPRAAVHARGAAGAVVLHAPPDGVARVRDGLRDEPGQRAVEQRPQYAMPAVGAVALEDFVRGHLQASVWRAGDDCRNEAFVAAQRWVCTQ